MVKGKWAHVIALQAAIAEGDVAAAEKSLAAIDAAAGDDSYFQIAVQFAHGSVCAAKGDLDEARSRFDKVMAKSPLHYKGLIQLADALAKAGKTDEANELRAKISSTFRRDFAHVALRKRVRSAS